MAIGLALVLVAFVGAAVDGDDDGGDAAMPASSTSSSTTSITSTSSTTTSTSTTTTSTTSSTTTTTSTTSTSTTTTTVPPEPETLAEFVVAFNASTTSDLGFAFDRLHPVVLELFGADMCRTWLEQRFAGTTVEIVGEPGSPAATRLNTPSGPVDVDDLFTVLTEITFQGSVSDAPATYAYVDGLIHWFTSCEDT